MSIKKFKDWSSKSNQEYLINEGGNAIPDSRAILQKEIPKTLEHIKTTILQDIFKIESEDEWALLGSAGKKIDEDDVSGDLDIAISVHSVAGGLQCDILNVEDEIEYAIKQKYDYDIKISKGLGIIHIAYPIQSSLGGVVQLDLMLSDSIEWTRFAYYSPDFRKLESDYKGLYRNIALMKIASSFVFDEKKNKENQTEELERYSLNLSKGLFKVVKNFIGTRGKLIKNPKTINRVKITNNPKELVSLLLGDKFDIMDLNTFESILNVIDNPDFKQYEKKNTIYLEIKNELEKQKIAIPDILIQKM